MPVMAGNRSEGTMARPNGVRASPQAAKVMMVIAVIHHGSWELGTHLPPRPKREEQPGETEGEDQQARDEDQPVPPTVHSTDLMASTHNFTTHAASSPTTPHENIHQNGLMRTSGDSPNSSPLQSTTRRSGTA